MGVLGRGFRVLRDLGGLGFGVQGSGIEVYDLGTYAAYAARVEGAHMLGRFLAVNHTVVSPSASASRV